MTTEQRALQEKNSGSNWKSTNNSGSMQSKGSKRSPRIKKSPHASSNEKTSMGTESHIDAKYRSGLTQNQPSSDEYDSQSGSSYYSEEESSDEQAAVHQCDQASEYSDSSSMDSEYELFIEKFGHLDFRHLEFLPKIKTK